MYWFVDICKWCRRVVYGEDWGIIGGSGEGEVFLFSCDLVGDVLLVLWGFFEEI